MTDVGLEILKDALLIEEGLPDIFTKWSVGGDFTYELRFSKTDEILIIITDVGSQQIEVFKLDVTRLI